ncbi:hypothetical protein [Demequina sp. NBRC 110056]|uniref:hypothetical protein n=1 Tax=Demequina sp. NBRC 110056 TaxID=1570345 RepID=UPI000A05FDEC|nr:hypothetical protein [Demequina sp. NBRC 110056]
MKLSDALRGAADRAPMGDAHVSVEAVTGRVRRQRAVRTGSAGVLGAGACAVLAFGAMGPLANLSGSDESTADMAVAGEAMEETGATAYDGGADSALARPAEQWWCGSTFSAEDGTWAWGDASGVTFELGEPAIDGTELQLPHTLTVDRPVDLISSPDALIVWDGIVVGRVVGDSPFEYGPADEPMLPDDVYERLDPATEFTSLEQTTVLEAANCWDGAPLPAGKYEVHQAWTLAYADGTSEPAPIETPEEVPSDELVGPTPDDVPQEDIEGTDPSVVTDGAESGAAESGAAESGTGGGSSGSAGSDTTSSRALPETFRVAAGPTTLVIEGDPVDDPFGAYLGHSEPGEPPVDPIDPVEPNDPVEVPDDLLTPEKARALFDATRASALWDMAPGSQRWVKANDAATQTDGAWESLYYGCVWDSGTDGTFPSESADMGLLDVRFDAPASISVSYGYVVDGNPLVSASTTNVSEYTIPSFWGGQTPMLALVRDGRVVAESYTEPLQRGGYGMAEPAIAELSVMPDNGHFAPGATDASESLLRNVNACDGSSGVAPGTYTLLTHTSVYVGGEYAVAFGGEADALVEQEAMARLEELGEAGATGGFTAGDEPVLYGDGDTPAVEPDMISIAPAPDGGGDWVEFQVWTALGTLTVR